jgi:hypothetical protein
MHPNIAEIIYTSGVALLIGLAMTLIGYRIIRMGAGDDGKFDGFMERWSMFYQIAGPLIIVFAVLFAILMYPSGSAREHPAPAQSSGSGMTDSFSPAARTKDSRSAPAPFRNGLSTDEPPFPRKNGNRMACNLCDGTGVIKATWDYPIPDLCWNCRGTGVSPMDDRHDLDRGPRCPFCGGSGLENLDPVGDLVQQCRMCRGTGRGGWPRF